MQENWVGFVKTKGMYIAWGWQHPFWRLLTSLLDCILADGVRLSSWAALLFWYLFLRERWCWADGRKAGRLFWGEGDLHITGCLWEGPCVAGDNMANNARLWNHPSHISRGNNWQRDLWASPVFLNTRPCEPTRILLGSWLDCFHLSLKMLRGRKVCQHPD